MAIAQSCPAASRQLRLRRALEARNRLVEAHRDLVPPIAGHYSRCSREGREDLLQVGLIGLIRAAELFDPRQQTPFTAFARPHIRGAILHHLRDVAPAVRLPRRQAELQERLLKLERDALQQGRIARPADLQRALGINAHQWDLLMRQRLLNRPGSLAELLGEEQFESITRADQSTTLATRDVDALTAEQLLEDLEPRQRLVVQQVVLRGLSYRQLARRMEVSPMTVQRLLQRGLAQLRIKLEGEQLRREAMPDPSRSVAPVC